MRVALTATAAALLLATAGAMAQQAQPKAATAQPPVGLGVGLEEGPQGPVVASVAPGGTAAAVDMRPGDIILQLGGKAVTGPAVLSEYVQGLKVGDPVSVLVRREGRDIELKGKAMARPAGFGPSPPPPDRSTPVEAGELRETWNDRVSNSPPIGAMTEFDGWSMGAAMPLPRSEHAVAEVGGKIWVLGGYPPGRLHQTSSKSMIRPPAAGRSAQPCLNRSTTPMSPRSAASFTCSEARSTGQAPASRRRS